MREINFKQLQPSLLFGTPQRLPPDPFKIRNELARPPAITPPPIANRRRIERKRAHPAAAFFDPFRQAAIPFMTSVKHFPRRNPVSASRRFFALHSRRTRRRNSRA
jgi:hypothetical protein